MLRYRKILSSRNSAYRKDTVSLFGNRFWQLSKTGGGVCEPTESAKPSPQPDALHHITTHINTIIYSVRCCFAMEHPWPEDWWRDGCAERRNSSTKGKAPSLGSVPALRASAPAVRGIGGLRGDGCAQGLHGAYPGRPVRGTACGRVDLRHRTLPAPRPTSPGSCCPRVPFTAGARAFRLALPAPRDTRLGARGTDMR